MQVENNKKKILPGNSEVWCTTRSASHFIRCFFTRATDFAEIEMLVVYVCPVS